MKVIKNKTGSKQVKIMKKGGSGDFFALYCQVYGGEEQVLQSKTFANQKNAERWANKTLGIEVKK